MPVVLSLIRPLLAVIFTWTDSLTITEAFAEAGYVSREDTTERPGSFKVRAATVSIVNFAVTIVDAGLGTWSVVAFRLMDQKAKRQHRENFLLLGTVKHAPLAPF